MDGIKKLYRWVVERFSNHGSFFWVSGFRPCTPEAKRHMKEVHKEKGRIDATGNYYDATGNYSELDSKAEGKLKMELPNNSPTGSASPNPKLWLEHISSGGSKPDDTPKDKVHKTKGRPMWELKPEDIDPFFMDKTKGRPKR